MNTPKRVAVSQFLQEFMVLFIALVVALALLPTISGFASTASVRETAAGDTNGATLIGLIPLLVVVVIIGAIVAVLYNQFKKVRGS